jgi:hypothetical protein
MLHLRPELPESGYVVDCRAIVHQYNGTAEHGGQQLFSLSTAAIMVVPLSSIHSVVGPVVALKDAESDEKHPVMNSVQYEDCVRRYFDSFRAVRNRSDLTYHWARISRIRNKLPYSTVRAIELCVEQLDEVP